MEARGHMQASLAMLGLGRMGGNMVRRLMRAGHACVVFDRDEAARSALAQEGAVAAGDLDALVSLCSAPRCIWMMLPAGDVTEQTIDELSARLDPGDVVVDGGNAHWQDDAPRSKRLKEKGIDYVDVGVSGGILGLSRGYCLMIGGPPRAVGLLRPFFEALAPGQGDLARASPETGEDSTAHLGYLHCGEAGAGHFVKMVHNAIEYGMMQAFAEGFELMQARGEQRLPEECRLDLDIAEIAELWRRGSVVTSWLLDLTAEALGQDASLSDHPGRVADSGEGRWAVQAALESGIPTPALTAAMQNRFDSQRDARLGNRLLSAMRKGFGGHRESG